MAFLLNKTNLLTHSLLSNSQTENAHALSRRGFHVEPGPREKALLAPDPALSRFKSYKKSVKRLKRLSDVLTIVVAAGMLYFSKKN
ncbi:hypothetical protein SAY86_016126 [Trapa natans]|uniref:Uncharacterized protein n=1 Tax=Trapa natans TaxID=22666 RepID=A0AAN7LD47_TRANT|nr:hypothetical protein SAY86_016126 [Trapa natans]